MTQEQQLNICGLVRLKLDGRNRYYICGNYWIRCHQPTPTSPPIQITFCDMCNNTKSQTVRLFVCSSDINSTARFFVCSKCFLTELLLGITVHSEVI